MTHANSIVVLGAGGFIGSHTASVVDLTLRSAQVGAVQEGLVDGTNPDAEISVVNITGYKIGDKIA